MSLRALLVGVTVTAVFITLDWVMAITQPADGAMPLTQLSIIALLLIVYAVLLAIPFVPGVEIGVTVLVLQGAAAAPAVYLATLLGLSIAFFAGRHIPQRTIRNLLLDLRMTRLCALLDQIEPLSEARRLALFRNALPVWMGTWPLRFRYLALALLINLPGSSVVGGGGGILFLAGFSRLFLAKATLLTLALAVAPVPLLVWLIGPGVLP